MKTFTLEFRNGSGNVKIISFKEVVEFAEKELLTNISQLTVTDVPKEKEEATMRFLFNVEHIQSLTGQNEEFKKTILDELFPEQIIELFKIRGYSLEDVSEVSEGVFRVRSAYGPGDFKLLSSGLIEQSYAGFIGREEKVCYVKLLDPENNFEVIYEEMI